MTSTPFAKQLARARKRAREKSLPATLSLFEWTQTVDDFQWMCAYCGNPYWTIDHFIPMVSGGGTTVDNCLPTCRSCNGSKGGWPPDVILPKAIFEQVRRYLHLRALGLSGKGNLWSPLSLENRKNETLMSSKRFVHDIHSISASPTKRRQVDGKELRITALDNSLVLQLSDPVQDGDEETTSYHRMAFSLTPADAVTLAADLLAMAAPQVEALANGIGANVQENASFF